jgi:D-aminopeptidase
VSLLLRQLPLHAIDISKERFRMNDKKKLRARDFGISFDGVTGTHNAITDVAGVRVGHCTILSATGGDGARTGVTAIFPFENFTGAGVPAGMFAFNGTGELTGSLCIQEFGAIFGPIMLTGTLSVGAVRDATLAWIGSRGLDPDVAYAHVLPVVGETFEGDLSAAWKFPVRHEHVVHALENAHSGPVAEGTVGGGTGMVAYDFKGGIGTSSRVFHFGGSQYTIGALVQSNHGSRATLSIAGIPVGKHITTHMPETKGETAQLRDGSIIVVLATDAPLLPHQLTRIAKRATIGLARTGGFGTSTSGDIFVAFSTAAKLDFRLGELQKFAAMPSEQLDDVIFAAAWVTEEAIINSLVAATTVTSEVGLTVHALPHDKLRELFKQ